MFGYLEIWVSSVGMADKIQLSSRRLRIRSFWPPGIEYSKMCGAMALGYWLRISHVSFGRDAGGRQVTVSGNRSSRVTFCRLLHAGPEFQIVPGDALMLQQAEISRHEKGET